MDTALYKLLKDGLVPVVKSVQQINISAATVTGTTEYRSPDDAIASMSEIVKTITITPVNPNKCVYWFMNTNSTTSIPSVNNLAATSISISPDQGVATSYVSRTKSGESVSGHPVTTTYYKGQIPNYKTSVLLIEFY